MKRSTIVNIAAGLAIILVSILVMKKMESSKTNPKRVSNKITKTVSVIPFKSQNISFQLPVYGKLSAINKTELYAEVNGILLATSGQFLEGVSFKKGQVLLHIDDTEARANLMSQKSNYLNAISKVLPDLKLDFPEEYKQWRAYLEDIDLDKTTPVAPKATTKKVELFLTSQGVYSAYYNLKTAEARIAKYIVSAPYNGIVTESNIKPGTLVRPGQKMGEFVGVGKYELEIFVSSRYLKFLSIGNKVSLTSPDMDGEWTGTISRMNHSINSETQTVALFIKVSGAHLRDGMYMNGKLSGIHFSDAMKIPRKLVFDNNNIYTIKNDTTLMKTEIEVVEFIEDKAIIKGLNAKQLIVSETIGGAYPGMIVSTKPAL